MKPAYPTLDVELVCRKVHLDARRARSRVWPRIVTLESSWYQDMVFQLPSRKYVWLQNHIDTLKFDAEILLGPSSLLFPMLLNSFPHLRHLEFDGLLELFLDEYVLTFQASEELQQMVKNGTLVDVHRICFRTHNVQALANRMAQKFGSEYTISGTSHIMWHARIDGGSYAGFCATTDVSFEFDATGFRVTARSSDHEKVNAVLRATMSPQKFMPYD